MAKRKKQPDVLLGPDDPMSMADELIRALDKTVEDVSFNSTMDIVPTKLENLDYILGGGIPVGKLILALGEPGGGKSTAVAKMMASFQDQYPKALGIFIDSEQGMSLERLVNLGADPERTVLASQTITFEKIYSILEQIINYRIEKNVSDIPMCVVLDSETMTLTTKHLTALEPKEVLGYKANMSTLFLSKIGHLCSKNNITFIAIAHLRDKISMNTFLPEASEFKGLGNKKIAGSNILKYAPFQLIFFKSTGETINYEHHGFTGVITDVILLKNKNFTPYIKMPLVLDYAKGYNDFWSKEKFLRRCKAIDGTAWQTLKNYKDKKFQKKNIKELYETDNEFKIKFDELYKECMISYCMDPAQRVDISEVLENLEDGHIEELETTEINVDGDLQNQINKMENE